MSLFDIFDTNAQQNAANAQIAGINAGYGQLSQLYGQGQNALTTNFTAGLAPFLQNYSGSQAGTTQLGNVLGLNGPNGSQTALQTLQNTPGYQFQQQQGNNAINAAAAANGTLNSGNQALALSQFNQGLAGTTYNNYVSQLQPYLGYSTNSAGGVGNLYSGLGTALNNSFMGQGNAAYGAQTSIGNANANADLAALNASANIWNAGMNLGSGLLGFVSDRRAKEDIKKIGELHDGQAVYRYRYKGDPRHQIGLLAQEVEKRTPEAVHQNGTLKTVDYRKATDRAAALRKFSPSSVPSRRNGYAEGLERFAA